LDDGILLAYSLEEETGVEHLGTQHTVLFFQACRQPSDVETLRNDYHDLLFISKLQLGSIFHPGHMMVSAGVWRLVHVLE